MQNTGHRFTIEFYTETGNGLGQLALDADFTPAFEWTRLAGIRQGQLSPGEYDRPATILPLWHPRLSQPYLAGFRVQIHSNGSAGFSFDFSNAYFKHFAAEAAQLFINAGKLRTGDQFCYVLAAFPKNPDTGSREPGKFIIEDVTNTIPFREGIIADLVSSSKIQGSQNPEQPPIFIPSRVLSEIAVLAREAEQSETGGFLIGHLCRDQASEEIFAEITVQIPATHAIGELAKLSFTPETWTAARDAIALRHREEMLLGWWHSHPVDHWKCKNCPEEQRRNCSVSQGFFSEQDRLVHRSVFSRAWSMALVVSELGGNDASISMFGWNRGMIEQRGYYLMNADFESQSLLDLPPGETGNAVAAAHPVADDKGESK